MSEEDCLSHLKKNLEELNAVKAAKDEFARDKKAQVTAQAESLAHSSANSADEMLLRGYDEAKNYRTEVMQYAHQNLRRPLKFSQIRDSTHQWVARIQIGQVYEFGEGKAIKQAKNQASFKLLQRLLEMDRLGIPRSQWLKKKKTKAGDAQGLAKGGEAKTQLQIETGDLFKKAREKKLQPHETFVLSLIDPSLLDPALLQLSNSNSQEVQKCWKKFDKKN